MNDSMPPSWVGNARCSLQAVEEYSRETVTRLITDLEERGLVVNEGKMSYLREEVLRSEGE